MNFYISIRETIHGFIGSIKTNWKAYLFIFLLSVIVHFGIFFKFGASASMDYQRVYHPKAVQIAEWIKGNSEFPEISTYQIFHLEYIALISFFNLIFGDGNVKALVIFQVIISIPVFLLILYVSLKSYYSKTIAVIFTSISLLFFDNILWVRWVVPDSFHRALFITVYIILLELFFRKKYSSFLLLLFVGTIVLIFIRLDTLVLFIPVYLLAAKVIIEYLKGKKIAALLLFVLIAMLVGLFFGVMKDIAGILYKSFYVSGVVLPGTGEHIVGLTHIEDFDYTQSHNIFYLVGRQLKLMSMRFYQFVNVFPPFWSTKHKAYYALHMVPFYLLIVAGAIRAWKTNDSYFRIFLYVYLCSMFVHMLTFVDAAKRQMFSVLPFFIMFAGYGFDYLVSYVSPMWKKRRKSKFPLDIFEKAL